MKNVFFKLMMVIMLIVPSIMLATTLTTIQDEPVESVNFLSLAIEYAKFTFLAMIILAANHIVAGTFNLKLWWADTAKPAVFAYLGGLAIAALDIYAASWDFFIEGIVGSETDHTDFTNLALTGVILVAFIKGLFKINQTQEKVAAKKAAG